MVRSLASSCPSSSSHSIELKPFTWINICRLALIFPLHLGVKFELMLFFIYKMYIQTYRRDAIHDNVVYVMRKTSYMGFCLQIKYKGTQMFCSSRQMWHTRCLYRHVLSLKLKRGFSLPCLERFMGTVPGGKERKGFRLQLFLWSPH